MFEIRRSKLRVAAIVAAVLFAAMSAEAKDKDKKKEALPSERAIENWLVVGPLALPRPAFAASDRGGVGVDEALAATPLADVRIRPAEGDALAWFEGEARWTRRAGRAVPLGRRASSEGSAVAWFVTYLRVERYRALDLELHGAHPRRVWLDGVPLASGSAADAPLRAELALTPGSHALLVETQLDPQREQDWSIEAKLTAKEQAVLADVTMTLDPMRDLTLADVLDRPTVSSLAVSPDGTQVALAVRRIVPGSDDAESWIEIRRTSDAALANTWRGAVGARDVAWSPDGRWLSYVAEAPGGGDPKPSALFLVDRRSNEVRLLLAAVEHFAGYRWSPSSDAIVYWATVKAEKDERQVKLLEGLLDRRANHRDKQYLHLVMVPDGARRRLTAGEQSTALLDISPDGNRLLFSRTIEALEQRPFSRKELWELDLSRLEPRKLRDFGWMSAALYAPDGRRLLVAAPATAFDGAGLDVPAGIVPNEYDAQLFIWDPQSQAVRALTREFDPAVKGLRWRRADDRIYFLAEDREYERIYRLDPHSGDIAALHAIADVVDIWDLAADAPVGVVAGSSPWTPQQLARIDLDGVGDARRLVHPADGTEWRVRSAAVEPWRFSMPDGRTIDGRIYLPPGFDAARRYPAIVYYYGGTSPVGREFGGRYPKEYWAAHGYVVYVLLPSGTTGYGQEFAAHHVNNWGRTTADEVIEGTRRFLDAHPYVDRSKVGCIGASYGGFMTMLLATKTDLFAAAVSHAGISSIASYWGEGHWGYEYSQAASADSYPWNRTDLYVEQSPLYRADQVRVPLLLTHGTADRNVPVGESDQFFTALKLLGKDVDYLQIDGEDHWILDHAKRVVWSQAIVAWFDRRLKGEPEWWQAMFPPPGAERPSAK